MENDFLTKIGNLQQQYYSTHTKNTFFKSKQKFECANEISQHVDVSELIRNTVYIIPNTNKLFVDYTILKLYANAQNHNLLIQYIISQTFNIIENYGNYELHIMLKSFSISAAERYSFIINAYANECDRIGANFSGIIDKVYIYHTPGVMEHIITMFSAIFSLINKNQIIRYSKSESDALLDILMKPLCNAT